MRNWELKSSYLLSELIKFKTYLETLQIAQTKREAIYNKGQADTSTQASDALQGLDLRQEQGTI